MRFRRILSALPLAISLTVVTSAWAFHRNLTGSWSIPGGAGALIVHNATTDDLGVTVVLPRAIGGEISRLEFRGTLQPLGEMGGGPNDFGVDSTLDAVSFPLGAGTCDITGRLIGMGTVLGQAPVRTLRMSPCSIDLSIACDNGREQKKISKSLSCSGDWK